MKKINSALVVCLIFIMTLEIFSSPVLAYERKGTNIEQAGKINGAELDESQQREIKKKNYVPGEILVKYKNNKIKLSTSAGQNAAINFNKSKSLEKKKDLKSNNISVLKIRDAKTVEEKIAELQNDPNIEYAEPNYRRYPMFIDTNDTNKGLLWGLDNTGQTVGGAYTTHNPGLADKDIDAPEAWTTNEGTNASVIVAIIDSGVAYNHPDLIGNMWNGANCKDENGGALGGCSYGYDYEDGDKIPLPTTSSHGTHIAGIIAATKNNGKGIIGVAPQAKIMAIKSSLEVSNIIQSIDFAIQNGAKIINASYGDSNYSQSEYDAINLFKQAGGIFVTAAGNTADNNDYIHDYPSGYNLDNIISVAATDQNDALASFSNYGASSVDVGAPGTNIYSTVSGSTIEGTSVLDETFDSLTTPNIPSDWVKGGSSNNWGTYLVEDDTSWGKVLYGDLAYPYANNANTTITSQTYNLGSGTSGASIDFWTVCDTEYPLDGWWDYMQIEYSSDGVNFSVPPDPYLLDGGDGFKWDEPTLDIYSDEDPLDETGSAVFHYENIAIPAQYLTSNFKFRFRWITNSSGNDYDGCLVDDVKLYKYTDGADEGYDYSDGTSMAAPYVAGLAALIWGYRPELPYSEVKSTILDTGDNSSSLSGKTVSGKRINAYNALSSLPSMGHTLSGTLRYYNDTKLISGATVILEDDDENQIDSTTTDSSGFYEFSEVPAGGNYVVRVTKTDTDTANGINVLDLTKLRRHIVGLEIFNSIYKKIAADVNDDLSISILDLTKERRYITGIDSTLPSGNWKFYSSAITPNTTNYLTTGLTRTYTNLISDTANQDFIGIKMGDVNDSWVGD